MKIQVGDYVVWQRKRICEVLQVIEDHFLSLQHIYNIRPASLTEDEWEEIVKDSKTYLIRDLHTGKEFDALGFDLFYTNAMTVLAAWAKDDVEDE